MTPGSASGGTSGGATDGGSGSTKPMHVVPPTPPAPEPCSISGCPPDLVCEASGVCVTAPPACRADKDCNTGQHCGLTGDCLNASECRVRDDCGMAENCVGGTCMVGSDCGQTQVTIAPIPPNLLVLLDISTSMNEGLDGNGCVAIPGITTCPPTKIEVASQVITQMTLRYHDTIYWGLTEFPGDGACGPPASALAPGPGNADMVSSTVAGTTAVGTTPINASIAYVQNSNLLKDPMRGNYLLLLTDGSETCKGDNADTAKRIGDMAAMGIKTFVVGFGGGVDANSLNSFANAGGVPNTSGGSSYYQADSAMQLETALSAILQRVVGCDFALAMPPDDPAKIWAFLDNVMVERDSPDGWSFDAVKNTVTFAGAACTKLQGGAVDIDIVVGCPEPVLD